MYHVSATDISIADKCMYRRQIYVSATNVRISDKYVSATNFLQATHFTEINNSGFRIFLGFRISHRFKVFFLEVGKLSTDFKYRISSKSRYFSCYFYLLYFSFASLASDSWEFVRNQLIFLTVDFLLQNIQTLMAPEYFFWFKNFFASKCFLSWSETNL